MCLLLVSRVQEQGSWCLVRPMDYGCPSLLSRGKPLQLTSRETEGLGSCNHSMNVLYEGTSESALTMKSCQRSHQTDLSSATHRASGEVPVPSREVPAPSREVPAPSREGSILLFLQIRSTNRRGAEDFPEVSCLQYVNLDKFSNAASGKL